MQLPRNIGPFHIIGIGGIGMSAIAEIMLTRGYDIQGSDMKDSVNTQRLRDKGARIFIGHTQENLRGAKFVVISSAVKPGNPEYDEALAIGLPVIRRAEMLAELMRTQATVSVTGTHGKTTTTSMISILFENAALDPVVITGGIINHWGTNARAGEGDWMVVEADESDGTFVQIPTQVGVITNIDPEHLDYYGSVEKMHDAFRQFFHQIPFYGLSVAGIDHPVVRNMVEALKKEGSRHRITTFGEALDADVRYENLRSQGGGSVFDVVFGGKMNGHSGQRLSDVVLSVPGRYNVLNALAAIAVGLEAGIEEEIIRKTLREFSGVKRRFTLTGEWNGVSFYDDYAHHPIEIAAVLKAARHIVNGRVIAVVQPHRYTRLQNLFEEFCTCFTDADMTIVTPIYSAGEQPIPGIGQAELVEGIKSRGHKHVFSVSSLGELEQMIREITRPGDLVLNLGAGTITEWAYALPKDLALQSSASSSLHAGLEGAA